MSTETRELMEICEQLPEAKREALTDFARFLLSKNITAPSSREATEQWLEKAQGAGEPGITTDQVMKMTRGEP